MAYQIVYRMIYEEVEKYASLDNYNILISCGFSHEIAKTIAYKTKGDNQKSK